MVRWLLKLSDFTKKWWVSSSKVVRLYRASVEATSCSLLPVVNLYHTLTLDATCWMWHVMVTVSPRFTAWKETGWEISFSSASPETSRRTNSTTASLIHVMLHKKLLWVDFGYLHREQSWNTRRMEAIISAALSFIFHSVDLTCWSDSDSIHNTIRFAGVSSVKVCQMCQVSDWLIIFISSDLIGFRVYQSGLITAITTLMWWHFSSTKQYFCH